MGDEGEPRKVREVVVIFIVDVMWPQQGPIDAWQTAGRKEKPHFPHHIWRHINLDQCADQRPHPDIVHPLGTTRG